MPASETREKDNLTQVAKPGVQDRKDRNKTDAIGPTTTTSDSKGRRFIRLVPPRPFPTVPTSVSATGPSSAHNEGKNFICLTRKTSLGAYMRRCKNVILKDGYKTLYLSAMGAAIPLLVQLSMALPPILPFSADEIHTEVTTGTVEVQDEIIPEDEDEDITYQTRGKSTLRIVIKIGDGDGDRSGPAKRNGSNRAGNTGPLGKAGRHEKAPSSEIVYQEPEQESIEML